MTTPALESSLQHYADALQRLEESFSTDKMIAPLVLEILSQRDLIQKALETDVSIPNGTILHTLSELDRKLRGQATEIAPFTQSAEWRASFNPDSKAWWWFLETPKKGWRDRLDWLWSAVAVTGLTISIGLLGDIAPRFLTGGPDSIGAIVISAQSVLTLFAAGGALTKAGQEGLKRSLEKIKLPQKYWHEVGAASALVLMLNFFGLRQSLPWIATNWYTNPSKESRKQGDWGLAEEQLQRAIKLNADDAEAHFQLGNLYEDLQQKDKALPHYQLAIQGGNTPAINNLARLHILKQDNRAAVSLLLKALDQEKKYPLSPQTKHAILKNLGWARLKQKNYPDAQAKLEDAIALETKTKFQPYEIADSHCLLAQALEAQGEKTESSREWKTCNQNANITIPEQDEWATIAQKKLVPKE